MRDTTTRAEIKRLEALVAAALARTGSLVPQPNPFWLQSAVFIDPLNRTGHASNSNVGTDALLPIRNWSEVLRRYGTEAPRLPQSTDWHFLSGSPTDGSDPILFAPTMLDASTGRILADYGPAQLVGAGTLAGVVAKDRATGTLLQADLSSVPGAAVNQVIQNIAPGKASRAIIVRSLGGGNFAISQPQQPSNGVLLGTGENEVNNWANTDPIQVYQPDLLDLVRIIPTVATFNNTSSNFFTIWQCGSIDPTASTGQVGATQLSDCMYITECVFHRREVYRPSGWTQNVVRSNTWNAAGMVGAAPVTQVGGQGAGMFAFGGGANGVAMVGKLYDGDFIVFGGSSRIFGGGLGSVYVDSFLRLSNQVDLEDLGTGVALYGPGGIDVSQGRLFLSGTTAVASLLVSGGITIDGRSAGFTATAVNPSVVDGNVTITPAAIDAAPMGQIFVPGGGAIGTVGD